MPKPPIHDGAMDAAEALRHLIEPHDIDSVARIISEHTVDPTEHALAVAVVNKVIEVNVVRPLALHVMEPVHRWQERNDPIEDPT